MRKPTSKEITLPSGGTCKVRRLNAEDLTAMGNTPDIFAEDKKRDPTQPLPEKTPEEKEKEVKRAIKFAEVVLLNCTGSIREDGKRRRIVKKHFDDTAEDELSVDEFRDTEDSGAILQAVLELSGMTDTAKEAVRPFPEKQEGVGDAGRDSQALQVPAEPVA